MTPTAPARSTAWKWYVCALLGLATTINYMDRQTLATVSTRIITEFHLTNEQYGELEMGFGLAFAVGTSLFGFIADRTSIRWLYPAVLVLWSTMGFFTGLVETYAGLFLCRTFLGLFEAGHWPCALKTTQWLLTRKDRTMGNSILQSGASIGAIATPLLMKATLTDEPGSWRPVFQMIGLVGMIWAVVWLTSIRRGDLGADAAESDVAELNAPKTCPSASQTGFWYFVFSRRFLVLLAITFAINSCWHVFRYWLPRYLQNGLGYSESEMLYFTSVYYGMTDAGCITAGATSLWLHRRGMSIHNAQSRVFLVCSSLTMLSVTLPFLPGWWKLATLLVIGFGALGLFPCYYSFTQELSIPHQGKITGLLGSFAWISSSGIHKQFGRLIDATGSYDVGFVLAGTLPLVSFVVLALLWNESQPSGTEAGDSQGIFPNTGGLQAAGSADG